MYDCEKTYCKAIAVKWWFIFLLLAQLCHTHFSHNKWSISDYLLINLQQVFIFRSNLIVLLLLLLLYSFQSKNWPFVTQLFSIFFFFWSHQFPWIGFHTHTLTIFLLRSISTEFNTIQSNKQKGKITTTTTNKNITFYCIEWYRFLFQLSTVHWKLEPDDGLCNMKSMLSLVDDFSFYFPCCHHYY